MLAVDGEGREFDGDEIVAISALHLREAGELPGGAAVTVMSNYGFHQAMEAAGIEVATTKVGDRYVIEELVERGWTIGGEQSGHIIWTDFATTGDGLAAALLVMRAIGSKPLSESRPIEKLPQRLENVHVPSREALAAATALWEAVGREGAGLEGRGRVLVRPSGTEPLVRVMVEAPDEAECEEVLAPPRRGRQPRTRLTERASRRQAAARNRLECRRFGDPGRPRILCRPLQPGVSMCGIVGYVGRRPCRDLLIAGLEKLEYRGYDSAGSVAARSRPHRLRPRRRQPLQPPRRGRRAA